MDTASPTPVLTSPCAFLEWDSRFFGFRIGRVTAERLTRENISPIMSWCKSEKIKCLYFLANSDDAETTGLAEEHGFHLVDIRLTLRRNQKAAGDVPELQLANAMRYATVDDIPALRAIAAKSHHDSRFYSDTGFPPHLADALYETWIEKSCRRGAGAVLVALDGVRPAGYISCELDGDGCGLIGLVAIGEEARGQGLGSVLVNGALGWFADRGVNTVTVVTQGKNVAAQRLYQRCGFLTHSLQLWYHKWFHEP